MTETAAARDPTPDTAPIPLEPWPCCCGLLLVSAFPALVRGSDELRRRHQRYS